MSKWGTGKWLTGGRGVTSGPAEMRWDEVSLMDVGCASYEQGEAEETEPPHFHEPKSITGLNLHKRRSRQNQREHLRG